MTVSDSTQIFWKGLQFKNIETNIDLYKRNLAGSLAMAFYSCVVVTVAPVADR